MNLINADTKISDLLEYFLRCAHAQEVSLEVSPKREIYINRLDSMPRSASAGLTSAYTSEQFSDWFANFIRLKFKFLALVLQHDDSAESIIQHLNIDPSIDPWPEILNLWRTHAESERIAYLYRVSQLGIELVHQEWYNHLPEFTDWASLCRGQIEEEWARYTKGNFQTAYVPLWTKWHSDPLSGHDFAEDLLIGLSQNSILEGLHSINAEVVKHITSGETIETESEITDFLEAYFDRGQHSVIFPKLGPRESNRPSLSMMVATKLMPVYVDFLRTGNRTEDDYLVAFTHAVRDVFHCKTCDYLDVEDTQEGPVLIIRATSIDLPKQELQEALKEAQVYHRREGITGSILVSMSPGQGLHVGTNNLSKDSRQSPWHNQAYRDIPDYGPTYNFWVFPLFDGESMFGVFRVINKLNPSDSEDLTKGYWPYYTRIELLAVARWFELFWRFVREGLRKLTSTQSGPPSENQRIVTELCTEFDSSWLKNRDLLEQLVGHLREVVHRKVENRGIGCCIGVVKGSELQAIQAIMRAYPTLQSDDERRLERIEETSTALELISEFYTRVFPTTGMFVFDENGVYVGTLELRLLDGSRVLTEGIDAIKSITERYKALIFLTEPEKPLIRFFSGGKLASEFYLSHTSGSWKVRSYGDTLTAIKQLAPWISSRVIDQVYSQAWSLSYNEIGAMLVIASEFPESVYFSKEGPTNEWLVKLSERLFNDLAQIDGAMVISPEGVLTKVGVLLSLDTPVPVEIESYIRKHGKGARHTYAAKLSAATGTKALIIVVSKDRGISVFHAGRIVKWDL